MNKHKLQEMELYSCKGDSYFSIGEIRIVNVGFLDSNPNYVSLGIYKPDWKTNK